MLVIQVMRNGWREASRLPLLTRIGLAVALMAFVADVVIHVAPAPHLHGGGHGLDEHLAHLAGLAAMVIALAGIVIDGVNRQRQRRRSGGSQGGSPHALR